MTEPRIVTVQGLAWGSEGKGAISNMLAHGWMPDTVCSAWQPNAGHTAWVDGKKYVHSMLPIGALAPSVRNILLGPGSVIDTKKLRTEIEYAGPLLSGKRLIIHPQAAYLLAGDAEAESRLIYIGSTMKGSAQAAVRKILRSALGTINQLLDSGVEPFVNNGFISVSSLQYDRALDDGERILVEGAQGFGLGIHNDFYPYCTSRDVSTAQLLADCRIPFQDIYTVGVARTFPIRVANRFDKDGNMIGTSGPAYPDQKELDWGKDLGREPELTTVTKLPRRVFEFSPIQIGEACRIMRPDCVALTFCDYLLNTDSPFLVEDNRGNLPLPVMHLARLIQQYAPVKFYTFGPKLEDAWQMGNVFKHHPLIRPFNREPWGDL